jgi:hypothetical protein
VTEDYIRLGLRLGRHIDGLVDAYYGPSELEDEVKAEPLRGPAELARDAAALLARAEEGWLSAQLVGLETVAQKLAGAAIAYADEVERCYGVRVERVPESAFERAHEELDRVLPLGGSLAERYRAWREGDPIPRDQLRPVLEAVAADLRRRTRELVGLPDGEEAELEFVTDKPWLAYNYYVGGLRSRVAVNLDVPIAASIVVELVAHELYPGHHTERAWKEQLLVRAEGRLEESIMLIGTPQSLIAEGIAGVAPEVVIEDQDELTASLLGRFGIEYDAAVGAAVRRVNRLYDRVGANTALLLYEDGAPEEEARSYLKRWALVSDKRADHSMRFLTDPMWRAYVPTYAEGYRVCSSWVGGDAARFRRLLTEPLTCAELVA